MRRWPWITLIVAVAALLPLGPGARATTVEEGVSAAFARFKQALGNRDGVAAAKYIDDRTAAFYERLRRAALRMPKDQLLKQTLFFQVGVLSTRLLFSKDEAEQADGSDIYAKLAGAGEAISPDFFNSLTLTKVQPTKAGASAVAYVSIAGQPDSIEMRFFTQGGGWKIDLMRLLDAATVELQKQGGVTAKTSAKTVEKVVERDLFPIMARQSGKPVSDKLWMPLANAN